MGSDGSAKGIAKLSRSPPASVERKGMRLSKVGDQLVGQMDLAVEIHLQNMPLDWYDGGK